ELEAQRSALADAEVAVDRERAVLQRRMAELEGREKSAREELEAAVQAASEDGSSGRDAGKLEQAHAAIRSREAQLQAQERRLAEQQATLQRREADLELYARKLQQGLSTPPPADPQPEPAAAAAAPATPAGDDGESSGAARRLSFWSR